MLLPLLSFGSGNFCDGWKDGFEAGYCYPKSDCFTPLTPTCPTQRSGEYSYKHGYNRGFLAGKKRAGRT